MATKTSIGASSNEPEKPKAQTAAEDTFVFTLDNGDEILVGKPRGILKLKIREILTQKQMQDNELMLMVQAALSVRHINGDSVPMRNFDQFEVFLARFSSDAQLDLFMNKFNNLVNPAQAQFMQNILDAALAQKVKPADMEDFIAEQALEFQRSEMRKVQD